MQVDFRVQHVLGGTGVFSIFWNFFTIYVFEVRESFADIPTVLLSYYVWGALKIQVTFQFKRFSKLPKHSFLDKYAQNL